MRKSIAGCIIKTNLIGNGGGQWNYGRIIVAINYISNIFQFTKYLVFCSCK
jgi:hypothetical protein